MYSPDGGRSAGGTGSHSLATSPSRGVTCILAHSANVLTRLYRNEPRELVIAYCPVVPWNQTMYAATGTIAPAASAAKRSQPIFLASIARRKTTSIGWPTDLTTVA